MHVSYNLIMDIACRNHYPRQHLQVYIFEYIRRAQKHVRWLLSLCVRFSSRFWSGVNTKLIYKLLTHQALLNGIYSCRLKPLNNVM